FPTDSIVVASPILDAPSNLAVTAVSSIPNARISLSWTAPGGAIDHYQIERSQSLSGPFTFIANVGSTNFDDTAITSLHSYLYRVRAVNVVGAQSSPSNIAFGTAISFVDQSLNLSVTEIKEQ